MAARYWVGGTASWDGTAGTKWALTSGGAGGQAVPTTADDVFFTNLSTGTCTVAAGNTGAKSITCTGFTGTLSVTADITVAGSITLVAGMTYTQSLGVVTVTVSATGTITSAGKTFHRVTINAPGGTVQLADAFNLGTAGTLTLTAGTFTTNNFSVTGAAFSSSGTSTRTANLGSSTFTFTSSGTGLHAWNTSGFTNLTLNAGTSTINLSGANPSFLMGTLTFNNVTFSNTGSTDTRISAATGTIAGTFTITAPATANINAVQFDGNPTIGTLVAFGASAVRRLFFYSSVLGTARTLTVTTWATISNNDFRDITMNSSRSGTRLGNCGGNTNITFPAAKTVYWNLAGSNNWSATAWATTSGGAPALNNFPLAQDIAVFDNAGAATTVITEAGWNVGTINASARTNALTLIHTVSYILNIYGNYTLGSGVTPTDPATIDFAGRSIVQTITTTGKTIPFAISVKAIGGTVQLLDAYSSNHSFSGAISLLYGTFDLNGFTVTLSASGSGFSAISGSTKILAMGVGGTLIAAGGAAAFVYTSTGTISGTGTISLTNSSAKTFDGGGKSYAGITLNQGGAGALTIVGANTFGDITNTYAATGATSILFTAGTTSTFSNWNASGQATRLLTIGSVTAASHTLSKSTGTVSADYLSISRSTATGGATWYAGANSTNGGNNTGWIFTGPPSTASSGNFLAFFM